MKTLSEKKAAFIYKVAHTYLIQKEQIQKQTYLQKLVVVMT